VDGYTKNGWKCQSNLNVGFTITLTGSLTDILASLDAIIAAMLLILRYDPLLVDAITFSSIKAGSSILDGTAAASTSGEATASSTTATTAMLGAGLGAGLAGFPATSFSVVANGVTAEVESETNLPLIIGLSVGIPVAVIAIILSVYFYRRARKLQQIEEDPLEKDAKPDENSLDVLHLKESHSVHSNSPVKPDFSPDKLMEQSDVIHYDPDNHEPPCPDSAAPTLGSAFAEALHFDTSPRRPAETVTRIKRTKEGGSREGSRKKIEFLEEEPKQHDIEEVKL
jgi:hypothetical protein